ncbi:MAG: glycogen debranching protein [Muribaculaceae bacterium]|nr:glycogen debranching protein [Muribaculaceae bacterium]
MKKIFAMLAAGSMVAACGSKDGPGPDDVLYSCDEFTVYADSVVQGEFVAKAVSPFEITTNYRSAETSGTSPVAEFRFSLNSRDNEMARTLTHRARVDKRSDYVYKFGTTEGEPAVGESTDTLAPSTRWTVRVDMRPMLRAFADSGSYVTPTGDRIFKDDFKGLWIAGSVEPMNWDFENLWNSTDRKLADRGDGVFEVTLTLAPKRDTPANPAGWKAAGPVGRFPQFASQTPLADAAWNMAMHEIDSDLRPDSTYRAGHAWDGVWTRDVSYSIVLSLALLDPQGAMNSLMAKVRNGRIVQDTGTGGAWPVSSDREVWALAAWEIYCVTGDVAWLKQAADIVSASLTDDLVCVWDPNYQLMHGEQSYLDWREQTYPYWMQPADIYSSMTLGTNVVFARAAEILTQMNAILGRETSPTVVALHDQIKEALTKYLWMPQLGYYCGYIYTSPYAIPSPATDNLGQALAIIYGLADKDMAASIIEKTPCTVWGTNSVFPQQAEIRPYHNDAVWPFVQAYWNIAAARTGNDAALRHGLAAIYRAAAMFSTNKELFVAHNGDYRGTAINSDAQLWSATGSAAMILKVVAGMNFTPEGIEFAPVVPAWYGGEKKLTTIRYRDKTLDVTVRGTGNKVTAVKIDGKPANKPFFAASLPAGKHTVELDMADNLLDGGSITVGEQKWLEPIPDVKWETPRKAVFNGGKKDDKVSYAIFINGVLDRTTSEAELVLTEEPTSLTQVNVAIVEDNRMNSFSSKTHLFVPKSIIIAAKDCAKAGTKLIADKKRAQEMVEITTAQNTKVPFTVKVKEAGEYFIDVRYANGSGPINTENKCAVRTLMVNGAPAGAIVMPQRGTNEWMSTGFSNMLTVSLEAGENALSLDYLTPFNCNMNAENINTALIEYFRIIKK